MPLTTVAYFKYKKNDVDYYNFLRTKSRPHVASCPKSPGDGVAYFVGSIGKCENNS